MKNLMIYTSPAKDFDEEHKALVKLQIDNSLDLGWGKEDILLVTNFQFEYGGVKASVIDDIWCEDKTSNKMPVINYLFNQGLLENSLYWYHDFDAFQNVLVKEAELGLNGFDLGLTTYGYKIHWNCGVLFFRKSARDIFEMILEKMDKRNHKTRIDEKALKYLTDHNLIDSKRYRQLDMSYNVQYLHVLRHYWYDKAIKPLKILHFHPFWSVVQDFRLPDNPLNMFMYGKNRLGFPVMSERLIKVFNQYGIK